MPKVVITFEISKPYSEWKSAFDNHAAARLEAGIETVYIGHELDNEQTIRGVMSVPSMEALGEFMQRPENVKVIKESGHRPETTVAIPCSD